MTHDTNRSVTDSLPDRPPIGSDPSGHRSHGRTDGLTKKNSPSDSVSPNASPTKRQNESISPTPHLVRQLGAAPVAAELMRSIDEYRNAPSSTASAPAQPVHEAGNPHHCPCGHEAESATAARPVVSVVARTLDDAEYSAARAAAMDAWRHAAGALRQHLGGSPDASTDSFRVQVGCVVDDLGRMSEVVTRFFLEVEPALRAELTAMTSRWETACDLLSERTAGKWAAEDLVAGQTKTIGVLGTAVGKVAALHVDDGEGYCRACQTSPYPCETAAAIGVGQ